MPIFKLRTSHRNSDCTFLLKFSKIQQQQAPFLQNKDYMDRRSCFAFMRQACSELPEAPSFLIHLPSAASLIHPASLVPRQVSTRPILSTCGLLRFKTFPIHYIGSFSFCSYSRLLITVLLFFFFSQRVARFRTISNLKLIKLEGTRRRKMKAVNWLLEF